ncbi:MAG: NAD(P)-dependent oxidoreductase [Chloroflexi bacterium]|nr:NAD(P)-dependent oxidoreductase [Chloroflexota bacterium]
MHLLITGGDGPLARAAAHSLKSDHAIRMIAPAFSRASFEGVETLEGDLTESAFVAEAVRDVDAVIHLGPLAARVDATGEVLGRLARGTYELFTAATGAGVKTFIVGSSLRIFDRLPASWKVSEEWKPRPTTAPDQLGAWIAELCVRECARTEAINAVCVRFGELVDDQEAASLPYDPRWIHVDDAVEGLRKVLDSITAAGPRRRGTWEENNPREEDNAPAGGVIPTVRSRSWREFLAPAHPVKSRKIRRVVIFGAGGPVAASAARELTGRYALRLTDLRSIESITTEGRPQFPGAPLPMAPRPPDEWQIVDVRDPVAVMAACEGMDAIVNCTVVREEAAPSFGVNTEGAYNVMRAAAAHGIRRVVQTGPAMVVSPRPRGYDWDYDVASESPARPGSAVYFLSKYLGFEISRVFAEEHGLEVPVLLFCQFVNPEITGGVSGFATSWQDSGRAIRAALEVPALPSPYEIINIVADLPHGRFSSTRAREVLGWEPEDRLENLWG